MFSLNYEDIHNLVLSKYSDIDSTEYFKNNVPKWVNNMTNIQIHQSEFTKPLMNYSSEIDLFNVVGVEIWNDFRNEFRIINSLLCFANTNNIFDFWMLLYSNLEIESLL